jgi:hypothetical protein
VVSSVGCNTKIAYLFPEMRRNNEARISTDFSGSWKICSRLGPQSKDIPDLFTNIVKHARETLLYLNRNPKLRQRYIAHKDVTLFDTKPLTPITVESQGTSEFATVAFKTVTVARRRTEKGTGKDG